MSINVTEIVVIQESENEIGAYATIQTVDGSRQMAIDPVTLLIDRADTRMGDHTDLENGRWTPEGWADLDADELDVQLAAFASSEVCRIKAF